ncbi:hypothetical protein BT63DRAFT_413542 [Microthyrium microscopicum]|uniref:Heme haloperoxidase family profile domain-containing protein n=1 Tax=Microthyrium microscopicum TaxID=703497 RepID=A0A6A6UA57_9PEZI|nr:hypothetical protein BT63DRAFT_413542 [Microthyrium microscopicum]
MRSSTFTIAALASLATAQRPTNTSICDYYTPALLKENTAANQKTVLTLLVNTVVIGNYTQPNANISVAGILAPGTFNNTKVNLLPYFNGNLKSSNRGGMNGTSVNFLDDGGAAPLMNNMPSNGNTTSNQYLLLTHLYGYFGSLLGCSMMNSTAFPAYTGSTNMYAVHKFMDLNPYELGYFITQIGTAAASFGVAKADVELVGASLNKAFGYRCSPAAAIPPTAQPELQSMCIDASCPLADNSTCPAYSPVTAPMFVNGTVYDAAGGNPNGNATSPTNQSNGTTTGSGSASSGSATGAGSQVQATVGSIVAGLAFAMYMA